MTDKIDLNINNIINQNNRHNNKSDNNRISYPKDLIEKINRITDPNSHKLKPKEKKIICLELIEEYPIYIDPRFIFGSLLFDEQNFIQSSEVFKDIIDMEFTNIPSKKLQFESVRNLATCYHNLGKYREAIFYYRKYFSASEPFYKNNPNIIDEDHGIKDMRTALALTECYIVIEKFKMAIDILMSLTKNKDNPMNYKLYCQLGTAHLKIGNIDDAYKYYKKSLDYNNKYFLSHCGFGDIYLAQNNIDKAEIHFREAYKLNENNYHSITSLERMGKLSKDDDVIINLENKINNILDLDKKNRTIVNYTTLIEGGNALYNIYEKEEIYEKAFDYLTIFNEANFDYLNSSRNNIDLEEIFNEFDETIKLYQAKFFQDNKLCNNKSKKPIFIIGLPRSGTTLTEQIISSHSQVSGAGEVPFFAEIVNQIFEQEKSLEKKSIILKEMSSEKKLEFAQLYENKLDNHLLNINTPRITDKNVANYFNIGLINNLFPEAKIIHISRNPMDNCFSIFRTSFAGHYYQWSCHYENVIRYYVLYSKLMNYWNKVLPGRIYNFSYEKLLNNPDTEIKKLIKFCDLPFEEQVLQFNMSNRPVLTASSLSVRDQINKKSLERWKHYTNHLNQYESNLMSKI